MKASHSRVHYYHAGASAFGGFLTHPVEKQLPTQASSSLAQAGGHAYSKTGPFNHDKIASFENSYTEIFGTVNKVNGAWTTLVTSVVEGLNILEVVKADRVVARLSVEHPRVGYHPKISFLGTQYENFSVAGEEIKPVLDFDLLAHHEGAFPDVPFLEDKLFLSKAMDRNQRVVKAESAPEWIEPRYGWIHSEEERKKKGYVLCSLVDRVEGAKAGSSFGHIMHVPDFGNLFFGELTVSHGHYRLAMLRAEMGCAAEGTLDVATGDANGATMP